jgi:hypothetical protein
MQMFSIIPTSIYSKTTDLASSMLVKRGFKKLSATALSQQLAFLFLL